MSLGFSPFQLFCVAWVWESDAASRGVCIGWPEPGSGLYCLFADLLLSPLAVHLTRTTGPMTVRPTPTVLFRRNVHHGSYASSMGFVSGRMSVMLKRLTLKPIIIRVTALKTSHVVNRCLYATQIYTDKAERDQLETDIQTRYIISLWKMKLCCPLGPTACQSYHRASRL